MHIPLIPDEDDQPANANGSDLGNEVGTMHNHTNVLTCATNATLVNGSARVNRDKVVTQGHLTKRSGFDADSNRFPAEWDRDASMLFDVIRVLREKRDEIGVFQIVSAVLAVAASLVAFVILGGL